jgi:uncharacterized repeat protein (TIGR03803 family)
MSTLANHWAAIQHCNILRRVLITGTTFILFAVTPLHAQSYQDLRDFDCPTGCSPYDNGRLIQGSDGYFYGTTGYGGTKSHGTIFKVDTTGTSYSVLFNFNGKNEGYLPLGGLTLATVDKKFYGTTAGGGTSNYGILFSFDPKTSTFTVLHNFSSTESSPAVAPIEAKNFALYGTTQSGELYLFNVAKQTFQVLPGTAPRVPNAPPFQASDGYLYGTSQDGGAHNYGTVFRVTLPGKVQIVHSFSGPDGIEPRAPVVQGKDGNLYGTTYYDNDKHDAGTIFRLALPSLKLTTLHTFVGTDGNSPAAGLVAATDGNLYGTTAYGGSNGVGTIFQMTVGGVFTHLFDFSGMGGSVIGNGPGTGLTEHTNGVLYGLTTYGGANGPGEGDGVFYSLTLPNFSTHITLCCNWWMILDQPVMILGQNLTGAINIEFGSVQAPFQQGSNTYLTAEVPSAAIDSLITVTLATGEQVQSQQAVHILPKIGNLDPSSGPVGTQVNIVGGGFARTSKVTFGGVTATSFRVLSPSAIQATVPQGAMTGMVTVKTPNGGAASKENFTVN